MTTDASRQRQWDAVAEELHSVTDKLGMPIDPGILQTVIALRAIGIQTIGSCEGHLDWGLAGPWVDFVLGEQKEPQILMDKYSAWRHKWENLPQDQQFTRDGLKVINRAHQFKGRLELHQQPFLKSLFDLLQEFYADRPANFENHIIISGFNSLTYRIEIQGALAQLPYSSQDINKLQQYRTEMDSFAQFIKRKFFTQNFKISNSSVK